MRPSTGIPLAAENEYWTDEGIFMSLSNFKCGKPLPSNVTSDVNPYQYNPSDLPVDLWYLCSGVEKDAQCGYWMKTGEAREIFSNSAIIGLRTTLQYYEGQAPRGRKTDWVMQEYRITEKCNNNAKDHRALCRVFLADAKRPPFGHCIANIEVKVSINLGQITESNKNSRGNVSTSELMEKTIGNNTATSLMTTRSPLPFLENTSEMDCFIRGDYLELNDLVDHGSCSSSSANSSCLTLTSDDYFDSIALLRELEDDVTHQQLNHSTVNFNLSAPINSKEVVIRPPTLVSLRNDEVCKPLIQKTSEVDNRNKNTSNCVNTTTFSKSSKYTSKKGKKGQETYVSRTKRCKMMKYLCCLDF